MQIIANNGSLLFAYTILKHKKTDFLFLLITAHLLMKQPFSAANSSCLNIARVFYQSVVKKTEDEGYSLLWYS